MIGKIYISVVEFYNKANNRTELKKRPVLIVGGLRNNDYTVLPISTIKIRQNLDPEYDILLDEAHRNRLNLTQECFIRSHKQLTVHQATITKCLGDLKNDDEDLYLTVLAKMEQHNKEIIDNAF